MNGDGAVPAIAPASLSPADARLEAIATLGQATRFDVAPAEALAAVRAHDGPLLLDLDETLYLRNSTEDFLDSARPGVLALLSLRVLDAVRPWRFTGGEPTRDVWRVGTVRCLFPWTLYSWRSRSADLARRYGNQPLIEAARAHPRPIVATIGFEPIVRPLVGALLPDATLVAARDGTFADRRRGKLALAVDALGEDTVRRGMVVTDSEQDLPLLSTCARPLRTVWPEARYEPAHAGTYVPGQYLSHVKRPGERYIWRGIVQEDLAVWLLGSIGLAANALTHVLGLLCALLSFWAVYELGYADNDLVAVRRESDPKLSGAYRGGTRVATPLLLPWVWAACAGALALWLLRWPAAPSLRDGCIWAGVLLATHFLFRAYNRVDKLSRVWLYGGLQFARSAAFLALVPVAPAGAAAIGSHVLARWLPYYGYRNAGPAWSTTPVYLVRLLYFTVLCAVLFAALGPAPLLGPAFGLLLAWNLWRARHELAAAIGRARRLREIAPDVAATQAAATATVPADPAVPADQALAVALAAERRAA